MFISDEKVKLETVWVLSLCLKVLNNTVKSLSNSLVDELFEPGFVQCLVHIASKGTEFSQQWLIKDLEVCTIGCTVKWVIFAGFLLGHLKTSGGLLRSTFVRRRA